MTEEERADELLDAFEDAVRDRAEDHMTWRHRVDGPRDEAREALRAALLSSSAAERAVVEAHDKIFRLCSALEAIHLRLSDGSQTFDQLIRTTAQADDLIVRALSSVRGEGGDKQVPTPDAPTP